MESVEGEMRLTLILLITAAVLLIPRRLSGNKRGVI